MERIQHTEVIAKPIDTVYNQWTQFEEFPRFMHGIKAVDQLDDSHLHWSAEIGGRKIEWDAEIIDQVPDVRIVWRSTSGPKHGGKVQFAPENENLTRMTLVMEYEPEGLLEHVADLIGVTDHRVKGDLKRFKKFIEASPAESGAWRGEIHRAEAVPKN